MEPASGLPLWLTTALQAIGWAGSIGWLAILLISIAVLVPSVRAFVLAYFKTRGETYATKQDFDELLRQLQAQTHATEEIKQRLSFAGWRDQRGWELRREFYANLIRKVTDRQQLQIEASSYFANDSRTEGLARNQRLIDHWPEVAAALNMAGVVLEPDIKRRYDEAATAYNDAAAVTGELNTDQAWAQFHRRQVTAAGRFLVALAAVARADLFRAPSHNDLGPG